MLSKHERFLVFLLDEDKDPSDVVTEECASTSVSHVEIIHFTRELNQICQTLIIEDMELIVSLFCHVVSKELNLLRIIVTLNLW